MGVRAASNQLTRCSGNLSLLAACALTLQVPDLYGPQEPGSPICIATLPFAFWCRAAKWLASRWTAALSFASPCSIFCACTLLDCCVRTP